MSCQDLVYIALDWAGEAGWLILQLVNFWWVIYCQILYRAHSESQISSNCQTKTGTHTDC